MSPGTSLFRATAALLVLGGGCGGTEPRLVAGECGGVADARGMTLDVAGHELTLAATALGREGSHRRLPVATPEACPGEVRFDRGAGVTEWWREQPDGLEHGVTIERRPPGAGPLRLVLSVGGAVARTEPDGSIALTDTTGATVGHYGGLTVVDADGRRLHAAMEGAGATIEISIDDDRTRYPIVVDPLLTSELATIPGSAPGNRIGRAIAVDRDGSNVLVSAYGSAAGSIELETRTGVSTWSAMSVAAGTWATGSDYGAAVAISSDGRSLLVGAPGDDVAASNAGSARVGNPLRREPSGLAIVATLVASDAASGDALGTAVAIAADGTRAIVGAPGDDDPARTDVGSARVFVRDGSGWVEEAVLLPPFGPGAQRAGASVALDAAGTRALVGAPGGAAAYVFLRTGTSWAFEASVGGSAGFGTSVAIDADGSRALVGASSGSGSGYVFVRSGAAWTEETRLFASVSSDALLGSSVALSDDGRRALLGAPGDDTIRGTDAGSAHVYVRDGATWTAAATLVAADGALGDALGSSVGLSADGSLAFVGAPMDDTGSGSNAGSVRVFRVAVGPVGAACSDDASCGAGGFCVEGVCCDERCDGPCDACTAARTGGTEGTCNPLGAAEAASTTCRASTASCDPPEICTATLPFCPRDASPSALTVCRASHGGCDRPETCSYMWCPEDAYVPSAVACMLDEHLRPASFTLEEADFYAASIAMSVDGTRALTSAPYDSLVFSFVRTASGWAEEARWDLPTEADPNHAMLALDGDGSFAGVAGAPTRVLVRTITSWTEEPALRASRSIAFSESGSHIILGDPSFEDGGIPPASVGAVHVYRRGPTGWELEATVVGGGGGYGWTVALARDGSRAVVGVPSDPATGDGSGTARVLVRSGTTWTEEATLPVGAVSRGTWSVAMDGAGELVALGAWEADARVYRRTGATWTLDGTLVPENGGGDIAFPSGSVAVSADGRRIAVGNSTWTDATGAAFLGRVYLFERGGSGWVQVTTIDPPVTRRAPGYHFGMQVALDASGGHVLVGASLLPYGDPPSQTGDAIVYTLGGAFGTPCTTSADCAVACIGGVCCESSCGDGLDSCLSCSAAETSEADGLCRPVASCVDAGAGDGGAVDAGRTDAGRPLLDGGRTDAGRPLVDAGRPDASPPALDGGLPPAPGHSGCAAGDRPVTAWPALLLAALVARRRRRSPEVLPAQHARVD